MLFHQHDTQIKSRVTLTLGKSLWEVWNKFLSLVYKRCRVMYQLSERRWLSHKISSKSQLSSVYSLRDKKERKKTTSTRILTPWSQLKTFNGLRKYFVVARLFFIFLSLPLMSDLTPIVFLWAWKKCFSSIFIFKKMKFSTFRLRTGSSFHYIFRMIDI